MAFGRWNLNADLGADVGLDVILLCGKVKPRRAINSITIEQSHRRHLQLNAGSNQFFRHRSALQKTKSRPRMEFDVRRHTNRKRRRRWLISAQGWSASDNPG